MFGERDQRFPLLGIQDFGRDAFRPVGQAIEQLGHVGRHNQLRVRQGVHQEHFVALGKRHANVEL